MVLELPDDVVRNLESLGFRQSFLESANDLASPTQGNAIAYLSTSPRFIT